MKILHIIDNLGMGGANALLVDLAPAQKAKGHSVDILQLVESKDKTLTNKLDTTGVNVFSLSKSSSVYNPFLIFHLVPYLKRYDIIHVHLFPALYWVGIAKLISFCKKPLIYTEHSTSNRRRNKQLFHIIDKYIYRHCYNEVITCSDKAFESFKTAFPQITSKTIPNGVNISKVKDATPYSKKELIGVDEDIFLITMVARFAAMKRQDTIVESISRLPKNFHVAFAGGDSGELDRVKTLVRELNVGNRVHFLGIRPDIPNILKTSDAIVMASDYEGLSLSSIEGMASGRPFIATNVNGLREVVQGAGILFENHNAKELSVILKELKENEQYYKSTVDRCIHRASLYDITSCSDAYLDEYSSVIANCNSV